MIDRLLMLQLGFNVVMLIAILVLARTGGARAAAARERKPSAPSRRSQRRAKRAAKRAAASPSPAAGGVSLLDDLVARAEREELVAEKSLRQRLARLGDDPGGAMTERRVAG